MEYNEVMQLLAENGSEQTKKVLMRHGAREPFFGVKIAYLKKLMKKTGRDHALALRLYQSGNSDAMYFAGLICDPKKMTREDLENWVDKAYWYLLSECTVAWTAAESNHAVELGTKWIESDKEFIACAGWSALASYASLTEDNKIDLTLFTALVERAGNEISKAPNRVRYAMNGFIISAAAYIPMLTGRAKSVAERIGKVHVEMGGTSCKVPYAPDYISKIESMDRIGKKRSTAFC